MNIGGFQKLSVIDFPGKVSAVIFTQGCNFRCPYCHNPDLLEEKNGTCNIKWQDVYNYIFKRRKLLDGVVISGGEPTPIRAIGHAAYRGCMVVQQLCQTAMGQQHGEQTVACIIGIRRVHRLHAE